MNRSDVNDWKRETRAADAGWQLGYSKGRQDRLREWLGFAAGFFVGRTVTLPALVFLVLLCGTVGAAVVLVALKFFWWFIALVAIRLTWKYVIPWARSTWSMRRRGPEHF